MPTNSKRSSHLLTQEYSERLDESLWRSRLSCGLELLIAPKPERTSTFAMLTTPFGSNQTSWMEEGKQVRVPAGIAHFLEHQLFKKERGDLMDELSANGADANAQTTHTSTSYYFEGVGNFASNLELLAELAFSPWFDAQAVEIERDIITQEILSYRDQPYWVNYLQLLEGLYHKHPVRVDIAGDEDSISAITPEVLAHVHQRFYSPSACSLVLVGDLDPFEWREKAEALVQQHFDPDWFKPASAVRKAKAVKEPLRARESMVQRGMHVASPHALVGYKLTNLGRGEVRVQREMALRMALDVLFGSTSEFLEDAYSEGLISDDFGAAIQIESGFGYFMVGGESPAPGALANRIIDVIELPELDPEDFKRKQRKAIGGLLRQFDSIERTAFAHVGAWLKGISAITQLELIESITAEDAYDVLTSCIKPQGICTSVVRQAGENDGFSDAEELWEDWL